MGQGVAGIDNLAGVWCDSATRHSAGHETAAVRSACYQVSQLDLPSARTGEAQIVFFSSKGIDEILHSGNRTLSQVAAELVRASKSGNAKVFSQAIDWAKAFCHSSVQ